MAPRMESTGRYNIAVGFFKPPTNDCTFLCDVDMRGIGSFVAKLTTGLERVVDHGRPTIAGTPTMFTFLQARRDTAGASPQESPVVFAGASVEKWVGCGALKEFRGNGRLARMNGRLKHLKSARPDL